MATSREVEDQSLRWLVNHERELRERFEKEMLWNKALLLDAYRTMAGQSRGLQRQRRLIKRLQAELKAAKTTGGDST